MIRVDRSAIPLPPILIGVRAGLARRSAAAFFHSHQRADHQQQYQLDWDLLKTEEVLAALHRVFSNRCAFCGQAGPPNLLAHHFRPPQGAVGRKGDVSREHYWWLAYNWKNLYLACGDCRRAQGAKFPVEGQRARPRSYDEFLARERNLLIDPCVDDPERHLTFLDSGEIVSEGRRGQLTIETFDLNRPGLVGQRAIAAQETRRHIAQLARDLQASEHEGFQTRLRELYSRDSPFAALRRQLVNQWAKGRPRQIEATLSESSGGQISLSSLADDLGRVTKRMQAEAASAFFSPKPPPKATRVGSKPPGRRRSKQPATNAQLVKRRRRSEWSYLSAVEVREVEIRNFRAIDHLRLRLTSGAGEGSWLMLLGENGAGKTSVLQAIALALSGDGPDRVRADPNRFLRARTQEGRITVTLTGSRKSRELRFWRHEKRVSVSGGSDGVLVAGYGSNRLPPSEEPAARRISQVDNLFDPFQPLAPPASWLPDLSEEEFDAVARSLKRLLNLHPREELNRGKQGIYLVTGKAHLPLASLSDGYRAMATLALDMMHLFLQRWGSLEAAEGIVLVDELGAHLHPRWQMKVTGAMREAFPRLQFIVSTHDPLCLRGIRNMEVAVLRQSGGGVHVLHENLPPVEGLAVDQLLTSEHFGLNSTLDPMVEELLASYYRLLAERDRAESHDRELERIRRELDALRMFGSTRRERLALTVADEFVAAEKKFSAEPQYRKLKAETEERIRKIWQEPLPK